jgi:hypothetical protein
MTAHVDPARRFQIALDRARQEWAAADPAISAAFAGCSLRAPTGAPRPADETPGGVLVTYFGMPYWVTHPGGEVTNVSPGSQRAAHATVAILLLHYLLAADGTSPADRWLAFRELPDGLFYAQAFAGHAEGLLAARYGADLEEFRNAASVLGGSPLDLSDAGFRFQALPRVAVAVLMWAGDEELPGQARILFDASAGHYLPTEDLSGIGDWLAHRLSRGH